MPTDELSEADYYELLKYREPHAPSQEESARFAGLKKRGFLKIHHFGLVHLGDLGDHMAPDTWIITPAGKDALSKFEEVRRKEAEEERRYEIQRQQADLQNALSAKQTKLALIQTIIAVVSFVTGLFCEHYIGLLDLLLRWFG